MSVRLPALVPFSDPVTVCVNCKRSSCVRNWLYRCDTAKARGLVSLIQLPLAEVQAAALEHPSYWKGNADDDCDMPDDLQELADMIRTQRSVYGAERPLMVDYLIGVLGIDPDQVRSAMDAEWPETTS